MVAAALFVRGRISRRLRARNHVEGILTVILVACSTIAIFTTIGIILSVLYEAIRFFKVIPVTDFLFGLGWSPQMAIRADQVGSSGAFGAVPVFLGTALISAIAMVVAVPIGLMEIVLTGIHLGGYGQDLAEKSSLAKLIKKLLTQSGIERIRLSSIEINEIDDELLEVLGNARICRHLHLPLQSGSDTILRLMNRNYSSDSYRRK